MTLVSLSVLVYAAYTYFNLYFAMDRFDVKVSNIQVEWEESQLEIQADFVLKNPSIFTLKIIYFEVTLKLGKFSVKEDKSRYDVPGKYLLIVEPKSNATFTLNFSPSPNEIEDFPESPSGKVWFVDSLITILDLPIINRADIRRYCTFLYQ